MSLRAEMPIVAEFIDECRKAFGTEMVNGQIRLGMQGAETFHASENAHTVGTPIREARIFVTADKMRILTREEQAQIERRRK